MSSPREAIYDVLLAQRQRTRDDVHSEKLAAEWAEYERSAKVANAAYRGMEGRPSCPGCGRPSYSAAGHAAHMRVCEYVS